MIQHTSLVRSHHLLAIGLFLAAAIFSLPHPAVAQSSPPAFSRIVVFGDSLSDTGNIHHRTSDITFGTVSYPSGGYNYSDGRFTNSSDTDPASQVYVGVWHEQLARTFLGLPAATNSLDDGLNYAFGGATTQNGTSERTLFNNPTPFGGGDLTVTIDNMGKQLDDYLADQTVDPNALYLVWGGGNDLFDDPSAANVSATATRASMLVSRLASAGAKYILVPNVPPLGTIPKYSDDPAKASSLNTASLNYRSELDADLRSIAAALAAQGFTPTIYRLDAWRNAVRMYANPSDYGFINVTNSVQGQSDFNPDQFLFWDDIHPTTAGHYQTAKDAYNVITTTAVAPARAANLSTRLLVGNDERVSIVGFFITGDSSKKLIIRGIGPSLAAKGVGNVLADPNITLFDDAGTALLGNNNWKDSQAAEISATGLAPTEDSESAILATLGPGHYTAVLFGKDKSVGNGLVEVYDLEASGSSTLSNLSTRGFVDTGDNVMIGGFIVAEGDPSVVVTRAIGPSLTNAGITTPLLDPTLELHDKNGALLSANDNWKDTQAQALRATTLAPTDDRESATVATLPPGYYTAVVRGKDGTTGVALVEAYVLPAITTR